MSSQEMFDVRKNEQLKRLDEASNKGDVIKLKQLMEEDPSLLDGIDHVVPEMAHDSPLHIAASQGHVDFTIEVLRLKPQLAKMRNREGRLPLHLAAAEGHLQVIQNLLDQQVDRKLYLLPESKYGYTPAHVAAINGEHAAVKMLVERCMDVLDKTTQQNETLLHLAIKANCLDSVRYLINKGIDLNEKDVLGNTGLHLACQKRNHQMVAYLLDQRGMEVNSTNDMGLTPLDLLLVSSWDFIPDVSLVDKLRRAGGQRSTEIYNSEPNFSKSIPTLSHRNKHMVENQSEAQTLLIVATLVAAMTYQAISNPPGGFIQLPFEKGDLDIHPSSKSTFYLSWVEIGGFPSGRPVLLWRLKNFFILNSLALFSSISVILILLCGIPRTKIMMKFLTGVLWLAAFCTALAFASVFLSFYFPYPISTIYFIDKFPEYIQDIHSNIVWVFRLVIGWCVFCSIAGLWASCQVIRFLWRKGGFKGNIPNWCSKVRWPKNEWFRKTTSIIFIVFFLAIISFVAYELAFPIREFMD